jgi:hypothetical protein
LEHYQKGEEIKGRNRSITFVRAGAINALAGMYDALFSSHGGLDVENLALAAFLPAGLQP